MASKRYGMLIDLRKCVGCEGCTVACKAENGVALGHFRTRVQSHESGTYPKVSRLFMPVLCNHCDDPACVKVCPAGASIKREDGIVYVNQEDCIGCQYCVPSCPYEARYYNEEQNVVDKCTFCMHRVDAGIVPSCANTCIANGRVFGDLNDPESEIAKAIKKPGVMQVGNTGMYYLVPDNFDKSKLPPAYAAPAPYGLWQSALQPIGKVALGGAAAAAVISLALNATKKSDEKEGEHHD
ncbi:MAG TPA: 4Fe-4S dicluster domain-containing protein [Symbiobacteriaceae bacterium]|nr:4Fe-4S dicluster domain-containing protein [Symbiobacteriaceae bacterium]